MAHIDTLVEDIYDLLDKPNKDLEFEMERKVKLGARLVTHITDEVRDPDRSDRPPHEKYVTQFTSPCSRRVWYNLFADEHGIPRERVRGDSRFKFLYGDMIEEAVLYLAELAGHTVGLQQERLSLEVPPWLITGRIDAMIDGWLIDVKSMEQYSFARMVKGEYTDKWGYYSQLGIYDFMLKKLSMVAPVGCALLAVNKTNGKLHVHKIPNEEMLGSGALLYGAAKNPHELHESPLEDRTTKSGMAVLAAGCAYCPFKFHCYKNEGVTVYAYAEGPTFTIGKHKAPRVPDITEAYKSEVFKK